jgi:hypothetical protein
LKVAHRLPAGRCGRTAAENASVIVIGHAPTMSIDQLSHILRLSHAGTVSVKSFLDCNGAYETHKDLGEQTA